MASLVKARMPIRICTQGGHHSVIKTNRTFFSHSREWQNLTANHPKLGDSEKKGPKLLTPLVTFGYIACCCHQIPYQSKLWKEEVSLTYSLGDTVHQVRPGQEVAGHFLSAVKRAECWFCVAQDQVLGMVPPTFSVVLSTSINLDHLSRSCSEA